MKATQIQVNACQANVFVLAITGCSRSGKTSLSETIQKMYKQENVIVIHQDHYYKEDAYVINTLGGNWESIDAIDWNRFKSDIFSIISHLDANKKHLLIVEGFTIFHDHSLYDLFKGVVFLNLSDQLIIERRLRFYAEGVDYIQNFVIKEFQDYKRKTIKELALQNKSFIMLDGAMKKDLIYESVINWRESCF